MDLGKALSYLFDDPQWIKKILLAAFVMALPVLGQTILLGWLLDTLCNIRAGQQHPIPDWSGDDLARWLGHGAAAWITLMAWILPCTLVLGIIFACGSLGLQTLGGGIMSAGLSGGRGAREVAAGLGSLVSLVSCCLACLAILGAIIIFLGSIVPYIRFATTDRIDVGLDYRTNFALLFSNIGPFLVVVVIGLVTIILMILVNVITCGIGTFLTVPYIAIVFTYLYAGLSRLLEPVPTATA